MIYMNKYIIRQTHLFEKELESIYQYIFTHLKEPITAKKFYYKVKEGIFSLQYFPERHVKLNIEVEQKRNLHKLLIDNYVIIYEVKQNTRRSFYSTYFSW